MKRRRGKLRLSASIDASLLGAAEKAVGRGDSPSLSAWVSEAVRLKLEHDRRLQELEAFVRAYEVEYGEITAEEMRLATRRARARAVAVRGSERSRSQRAAGR